jgi:hypothetical protein
MIPGSQKPPKQTFEQHWALVVQLTPICWQPVGGGEQLPAVQVLEQQPALLVQAPPTGVHGVLQTCVVGSQMPRQHCASVVQAAASARQVSAPKSHRFGSTVSLHTVVQQPRPEPDVQVSPVGRQLRFARSTWHSPPWQMFEQHSAFVVQASLSTLHSPPPQRPLKQPSEQQSSAFVQATPSAKHAFVHWMTPDMPVTGSQRPLQHWLAAVQSVPGPWQMPPGPTPPPAPVTPEPPVPNVPPRPAPPSLPIPGAAGLSPHDASNANASKQIE